MAKIRVAQIKDLSLTAADGAKTLTVGVGNTITPLDEIAQSTENAEATSFLTSLTVNGNTITPQYKTIASVLAGLTGSATIATVANGVVTLKASVSETNGIISNSTDADITLAKVATTGAAEDVSIADAGGLITATTVEGALAEIAGNLGALQTASRLSGSNAINVTYDEGGNGGTVSLTVDPTDQVLTQSTSGLKTNLGLEYDSTNKQIKLLGKTTGDGETAQTAVIASIDATDFIKDGMLDTATVVKGTWTDGTFTENAESGEELAIKLVWNTDAGKEAMYINAETLVDSYTAGNEWIVFNQNTNEISHKTVNEGVAGTYANNTADVTVDSTTTKTFKVPTITVDGAGHVTSAGEKTVTITLPASIDTAVQTVNGETAIENGNSEFVSVSASHSQDNKTVTISSNVKTQEVTTATDEADGLATALDVKTYVDNAVATASHIHVVEDFVIDSPDTTQVVLQNYIALEAFDVVVYLNGLKLNKNEYEVNNAIGSSYGSTHIEFTDDMEVPFEAGDVISVSYYTDGTVNSPA